MNGHNYFNGLYYEVKGTGEPIVFLHGIGGSHSMFQPQVRHLANLYKIITIDLKGNGKSTSVKTLNYLTVHMDSILGLMAHLNIGQAHFVGLSYGGIVTQYFAIQHPEKVKKMILIDTYAHTFPKSYDEFKLLLLAASLLMVSWVPKKILKKYLSRFSPYKNWDLAQRELLHIIETFRPKDVSKQLIEVFNINFLSDLNRLEIPVLIMVGDKLKTVMRKSKEIADHLENSDLFVVKDSFDPANLCQPEIVNYEILRFLKEKALVNASIVH
ncbi:alpha/beta fold hydrolase [Bacillus sp. EB600]|uniref:alpha/beta fold hydrolase n=1 Tax=Bacillus sp. EB600 TaxID=2806345 RepID=UPI00210B2219|nr:alpha/beta hydrolase [Bacillus sp. EB600]MCQ6280030.1 alpha/beta hydrolase [Bacillus sp. EB600]